MKIIKNGWNLRTKILISFYHHSVVEMGITLKFNPDCWKVSSVAFVFKTDIERSKTKNYHLVNLHHPVVKVFKKRLNYRIIDNLEK